VDCSGANAGALDCYIDAQGVEQCPTNDGTNFTYDPVTGTNTNCGPLQSNPDCVYVGTQPIEEAEVDSFGNPLYYEEIYDCGYDTVVDDPTLETTLDCPGPMRCLGSDCMDTTKQQSTKFSEVVASLSAANAIADDATCANDMVSSCTLFPGEAMKCRVAFFGIVDCCETPSGVSLLDYMKMYKAMGNLEDLIGKTEYFDMVENSVTGVVEGAWSEVTRLGSEVYSSVSSKFVTTGAEAAAATTSPMADLGLSAAYEGFKQAAMNEAANFVGQTFGSEAGSMIFEAAGAGGFDSVTGAFSGNAVFTSQIQSFLTYLNWAMTIYTIAMILIQLIWSCEESEFELGARRVYRQCHYLGSYCSKKILFACIERKRSWCCYNSPLARILTEAIKDPADWGSASSPNCAPITVMDLVNADIQPEDLSEWIEILQITDTMPSVSNVTMEITGTDSPLNLTGTDRLNAVDRTILRQDTTLNATGLTFDQLYDDSYSGAAGSISPP
jgi:conjugal transfer mating pair stabilization protein TraN